MNSQHSSSVVVTVLNFNRAHDTIECVQSLRACHFNPLEIVVIDNGSTDGSLGLLQQELANAEVVSTGKNLGYTGGVNFSFQHVQKKHADYILVLNNDTIVERDFLNRLVDGMEGNKSAAAAGGTIFYDHDRTEVWYAGGRMIHWRGLAVHDHKGHHLDPELLGGEREVSFLTGCCILFRSSALETIGGEDERFFMYLDDIELSARILSKGFRLLYVPRAIIYHKALGETESPFKLYYSIRNRLLLIGLMNSGVIEDVARIYFLAVIVLKLIVWRLHKPLFYRAALTGLMDYFRGDFYRGKGFDFI